MKPVSNHAIRITMLFLFPCNSLFAQHSSKDTSDKNTEVSFAKAGVSYISNIVFAGRKDSAAVPYINPKIGYYHKSGLFAEGSFSFLTSAAEKRIDLYTITAGYTLAKESFIAELNATKYFFNNNSNNVQSEISGYAAAYAGYNFKNIVTIYADAMITFSSKPDFFSGTELSHSFYMAKDNLKISPSLYVVFGTQNYYSEYYTYRRYSTSGSGRGYGGSSSLTVPVSIKETSKFKLLSYEFSLPLSYSYKTINLYATPVLAIPVNPSTITVNNVTTKEALSNTFFLQAGIEFSF